MIGFIEYWNPTRAWGWIIPAAGGNKFFVHISAFPAGTKPIAGSRVKFEAGCTSRGPCAIRAEIISWNEVQS
jgi:cold shock CspA family protein